LVTTRGSVASSKNTKGKDGVSTLIVPHYSTTCCSRDKVTLNRLLVGDGKMKHSFSIEMKSKKHVRTISVSNESHDRVLFEGFLGDLQELSMVEGKVLEIRGTKGILRVDLAEDRSIRKSLKESN